MIISLKREICNLRNWYFLFAMQCFGEKRVLFLKQLEEGHRILVKLLKLYKREENLYRSAE